MKSVWALSIPVQTPSVSSSGLVFVSCGLRTVQTRPSTVRLFESHERRLHETRQVSLRVCNPSRVEKDRGRLAPARETALEDDVVEGMPNLMRGVALSARSVASVTVVALRSGVRRGPYPATRRTEGKISVARTLRCGPSSWSWSRDLRTPRRSLCPMSSRLAVHTAPRVRVARIHKGLRRWPVAAKDRPST